MHILLYQQYKQIVEIFQEELERQLNPQELERITLTSNPIEFERQLFELLLGDERYIVVTNNTLHPPIMNFKSGTELGRFVKMLKPNTLYRHLRLESAAFIKRI